VLGWNYFWSRFIRYLLQLCLVVFCLHCVWTVIILEKLLVLIGTISSQEFIWFCINITAFLWFLLNIYHLDSLRFHSCLVTLFFFLKMPFENHISPTIPIWTFRFALILISLVLIFSIFIIFKSFDQVVLQCVDNQVGGWLVYSG